MARIEHWVHLDTLCHDSTSRGMSNPEMLNPTQWLATRAVDDFTLSIRLLSRSSGNIVLDDEVTLAPPSSSFELWIGSGGNFPSIHRLRQGSWDDSIVVWDTYDSDTGDLERWAAHVRRDGDSLTIVDQRVWNADDVGIANLETGPRRTSVADDLVLFVAVSAVETGSFETMIAYLIGLDESGNITASNRQTISSNYGLYNDWWPARIDDGMFVLGQYWVSNDDVYTIEAATGTFDSTSVSLTGNVVTVASRHLDDPFSSFHFARLAIRFVENGTAVLGYSFRRNDDGDKRDNFVRLVGSDLSLTTEVDLGTGTDDGNGVVGGPSWQPNDSAVYWFYRFSQYGEPVKLTRDGSLEQQYEDLIAFFPFWADFLTESWIVSANHGNSGACVFLYGLPSTQPLRFEQRDDWEFANDPTSPRVTTAGQAPTTRQNSIRHSGQTYW